jgi:hypothetical protein
MALLAGAAGAAVLLGGIAGATTGGRTATAPAPGPAATSELVRMQLPHGWKVVPTPSSALPLKGVAGGGPAASDQAAIVAGRITKPVGAGLLPDLGSRAEAAPTATPVRLRGGLQALRYAGVRVDGRRATIFAIPTTGGVIALACAQEAVSDRACGAAAMSLTLQGAARPLALGADPAAATALRDALRALERSAAPARSTLGSAKRPAGQASSARRLAAAYGAAARGIGKLEVPAAAAAPVGGLAGALGEVGRAYERLASSAAAGDRARYRRASAALRSARGELDRARRALTEAGYGVRLR